MKISELAEYLGLPLRSEKEITGIVTSTKNVYDGCVLLCVTGKNTDPTTLIDEKIASQCNLIITDNEKSSYQYLPNLKERLFDILDYYYFNHLHDFKIIGITGTDGKSSLADIVYQGLTILKKKVLLISTEQRHRHTFFTSMTTPTSSEIIDAMMRAKNENYDYLIMEVSSIGIHQHRVDNNIFDYIFLTNLESDHLDYHDNLYHYHLSKISLLINNIKAIKFIFRSTYNKYPHLFDKVSNLKIIDEGDIKLKNLNLTHQVFKYKNIDYYTHLLFKQNRYNLVFLIEFLNCLKYQNLFILIKKIKRVKGRTDVIHTHPYIIIDYAHSPKSVDNILSQVSLLKREKIILVIGAGGNRDKTKRPLYGKSAIQYADRIIVCNDNPRQENPLDIAQSIVIKNDPRFEIILNRKKAIITAIESANKDDIVVILGRGNEDYQIIGNKKIALNDYEVCYQCLQKLMSYYK